MIVKDLGIIEEPSGKTQHRVVVECARCKNKRETRIGRVKDCFNFCKSCILKLRNTTHGLNSHPLNGVHNTMIQRCTNPKQISYKNYGAKGIRVCREWKDSFIAFYEWAISNGYKKGLAIDRINNSGNYEPNNCRWVTQKFNNQRNAKLSSSDIDKICQTYKQCNITQIALSKEFGVDKSRIGQILKSKGIKTEYRGGTKKKLNQQQSKDILKDKRVAKEIANDYSVHVNTIYIIKKGK